MIALGMLPEDWGKIKVLGNTSLQGAVACLFQEDARAGLEKIAAMAEEVSLAEDKQFSGEICRGNVFPRNRAVNTVTENRKRDRRRRSGIRSAPLVSLWEIIGKTVFLSPPQAFPVRPRGGRLQRPDREAYTFHLKFGSPALWPSPEGGFPLGS